MLADPKMLVLLDNAANEAQVAPLLPGTSSCLVIVTSRRRLAGLDQTRVVSLDVLPPDDAIALFCDAAGEGRTTGNAPELLAEVVELRRRLPLTLRVAGARLRSRPAWNPWILAERLRDHRNRIAELDTGGSVGAALELSYQELSPQVRLCYRLLGPHPGADLDVYASAALLDAAIEETTSMIDQLMDAHQLQEPAAGRVPLPRPDPPAREADVDPREGDRPGPAGGDHQTARPLPSHGVGGDGRRIPSRAVSPPGRATDAHADPDLPDPARASNCLDSELSNIVATVHGRWMWVRGGASRWSPGSRTPAKTCLASDPSTRGQHRRPVDRARSCSQTVRRCRSAWPPPPPSRPAWCT